MEVKASVKETEELIIGFMELSVFLVERLKDGFQMDDVSALMSKLMVDEEFKKIMQNAYQGASKAPVEVKNMGMEEIIHLSMRMMSLVPKFIEAVKA